MRVNSMRRYQADKIRFGLDGLIHEQKEKMKRWTRVQQNQESNFRKDLVKFQTAIQTRQKRIARIMGGNIVRSRDKTYQAESNEERRKGNLNKYMSERRLHDKDNYSKSKRFQRESYQHVNNNKEKLDE